MGGALPSIIQKVNQTMEFIMRYHYLCNSVICLAVLWSTFANAVEPRPSENPYLGTDSGLADPVAMHGNSATSDTRPWPSSGVDPVDSEFVLLGDTCSTVLMHISGNPIVICTDLITRAPVIRIIDGVTNAVLDKMLIETDVINAGVHAYINYLNQVVITVGADSLMIIDTQDYAGNWQLSVNTQIDLSTHIPSGEYINSISLAADGGIWFVTDSALVGRYDPLNGTIQSLRLNEGETFHNSLANSGDGKLAIATDSALYLVEYHHQKIEISWREGHDFGSQRKSGRLSQGTGSSPSFFGPVLGTEYVAMPDNTDVGENVLIYSTNTDLNQTDGQRLLCNIPMSSHGTSENSPSGIDNSVVLSSTYGSSPIDDKLLLSAATSVAIAGGKYRVDIDDKQQCDIVWDSSNNSSAMPEFSDANYIFTFERQGDSYFYSVIDADTGQAFDNYQVGEGQLFNMLRSASSDMKNGRVFWQGNIAGLNDNYLIHLSAANYQQNLMRQSRGIDVNAVKNSLLTTTQEKISAMSDIFSYVWYMQVELDYLPRSSDNSSFYGNAGGWSIPGAGYNWGDMYTDDIDRLHKETYSFEFNSSAVYFSILFYSRNHLLLGHYEGGGVSMVSGIGGGRGHWFGGGLPPKLLNTATHD